MFYQNLSRISKCPKPRVLPWFSAESRSLHYSGVSPAGPSGFYAVGAVDATEPCRFVVEGHRPVTDHLSEVLAPGVGVGPPT